MVRVVANLVKKVQLSIKNNVFSYLPALIDLLVHRAQTVLLS